VTCSTLLKPVPPRRTGRPKDSRPERGCCARRDRHRFPRRRKTARY